MRGSSSHALYGDTMAMLDDVPEPIRAVPRRLDYANTIYGPRQSSLLGVRVSGTRRSDLGSIPSDTTGFSHGTALPPDPAGESLSRTAIMHGSGSHTVMEAESAKTVVNPDYQSHAILPHLSPRAPNSLQPPLRPLQDAANESESAASADTDDGDHLAGQLTKVTASAPKSYDVPGLFPLDNDEFRSSSLSDSLPSSRPSSFVSGSNETLASDALCPYIPGSFIVNPVHENATLAPKSRNRLRKGSHAHSAAGSGGNDPRRLSGREANLLARSPGSDTRDQLSFQRKPIQTPRAVSLLSSKLQLSISSESQAQLFLARYSRAGAGENDSNAFSVSLYFPSQRTTQVIPPLDVRIRRDASMEELIGYGLYCFVDRYGKPPDHPDAGVDNLEDCLETQAWTLHMVEDDLVDEDYPAMDRSLIVGRFGENEFALCPKSLPQKPAQPSRVSRPLESASVSSSFEPPRATTPLDLIEDGAVLDALTLNIMVVPSARGMTSIRLPPHATAAQAIETVCERCQLGDPRAFALLFRDTDEVLPGTRPVRGFVERTDLVLVDRTSLPHATSDQPVSRLESTMPEQPKYKTAMDLISNYKVRVDLTTGLFHQPAPSDFCWAPRACPYD